MEWNACGSMLAATIAAATKAGLHAQAGAAEAVMAAFFCERLAPRFTSKKQREGDYLAHKPREGTVKRRSAGDEQRRRGSGSDHLF